MKKSWLITSVLVALLLAMVSGAFAADLDTANPIKIGYVGALSGDTALWGQAGLNGLTLTAEMVNEDGGILGREVQIIGLDGKGAADDSVAAYKRLVEQEGEGMLGQGRPFIGREFEHAQVLLPVAAIQPSTHIASAAGTAISPSI